MLKMLVGMGGNTICKELYDWFENSSDTVSTSAFVQQREKILLETTEDLFRLFTKECRYEKVYSDHRLLATGYWLLAVDAVLLYYLAKCGCKNGRLLSI